MIAAATQLHVMGLIGRLLFLRHLHRVRKQLRGHPGLISFDFHRSRRTLTVWEDAGSMRQFRDSGAHREAMIDTPRIGRARTIAWEVAKAPTWQEAIARLDGSG
jgi:heme-degrading monooxygenase HmoA